MSTAAVHATTSYSNYTRAGLALIVLSCALFAALIAVPFLPIEGSSQVTLATGLAISSEGTFWLGAVIAGKDAVAYLRRRFLPASWQRKASSAG